MDRGRFKTFEDPEMTNKPKSTTGKLMQIAVRTELRIQVWFIISVCIFVFQACVSMADAAQVRHPYSLGGLLSDKSVKEAYVGARLGSYKPDLRQLDALLRQFNVRLPGAATMLNVFIKLKGSSQLSYLLEAGYWADEVSLEPIISADLGTIFTQVSFSFLYHPEMIQRLAPLYLGIGGGLSHLKLNGSALELLKEVVTERENTGVSGNFIVGLEYPILERVMVSVQTNHIFKSFAVDEEGKHEFSFDGTVVSIGTSVRF
jgi:hypothetical protein